MYDFEVGQPGMGRVTSKFGSMSRESQRRAVYEAQRRADQRAMRPKPQERPSYNMSNIEGGATIAEDENRILWMKPKTFGIVLIVALGAFVIIHLSRQNRMLAAKGA